MEEIAEAVRKLHNNHAGGPSCIRGEHLRGWLGGGNYRGIALVEVILKLRGAGASVPPIARNATTNYLFCLLEYEVQIN
eukprot:scaffold47065_cov60-Attheya_sp.AAC.3